MRFAVAGIILLGLTTVALGQAEGEVESIGFDGYYRPNTWTPIKLRLRPKVGETRTYKITVKQEDMDNDHVSYSRPFTLGGSVKDRMVQESVWVYFLPQPRKLNDAKNVDELANILQIYLCDESGKQLVRLPIPKGTPPLKNLDDDTGMITQGLRGVKLILTVGTSASRPMLDLYANARGILEEVVSVRVTPGELPGNVLGYGAVDAVVWLDSDPAELNTDSMAALQDYVQDGGKLVVCHTAQNWQKLKEHVDFGPMLPVTVQGTGEEPGLRTLRVLADIGDWEEFKKTGKNRPSNSPFPSDPWEDPADRKKTPWDYTYPIGLAVARPGAFVNLNCERTAAAPYLARSMYGMGTVTWVAQNLGDPSLLARSPGRRAGWQTVWDRVFDFKNSTVTSEMAASNIGYKQNYENVYKATPAAPDLSLTPEAKMEHEGKSAALIALAMFFFIGYWLIAGPGSYFFLLARKRAHFSWFAFGVCALAATGITVAVVKLVVRGAPEIRHATFVRVGADRSVIAYSQIGLYIPRDGRQRIELKDAAPRRNSFIAPYPIHPSHLGSSGAFTAFMEYESPVLERTSDAAPVITIPFRSTLKKLEAKWVGKMDGTIAGSAKLSQDSNSNRVIPSGKLTNSSGHDLYAVSMLYVERPNQESATDDVLITLDDPTTGAPAWPKGVTIDLKQMYDALRTPGGVEVKGLTYVGERGRLNFDRIGKDYRKELVASTDPKVPVSGLDRVVLLMSVFDRISPDKAQQNPNRLYGERFELLRRSGRHLDASGVISAGYLLIVARAEEKSPLPFPLHVQGDKIDGEGVIYFQFVVPVERDEGASQPLGFKEKPAGPASAPATRPKATP